MINDYYSNSVVQLKKPIKITIPDRHSISGLRSAARQEIAWSKTAYDEYLSERERAMKLKKGDALRNELLWDSRVAFDFYKIRKSRASKLLVEAEKLEKRSRGNK